MSMQRALKKQQIVAKSLANVRRTGKIRSFSFAIMGRLLAYSYPPDDCAIMYQIDLSGMYCGRVLIYKDSSTIIEINDEPSKATYQTLSFDKILPALEYLQTCRFIRDPSDKHRAYLLGNDPENTIQNTIKEIG